MRDPPPFGQRTRSSVRLPIKNARSARVGPEGDASDMSPSVTTQAGIRTGARAMVSRAEDGRAPQISQKRGAGEASRPRALFGA